MIDGKRHIAIMQPYFFPYIGYWQLIHAADKFVVYDDGTFIKQGWISRNRILGENGQPQYFGIEISHASCNHLINETKRVINSKKADKLCRTLKQNYLRAPYYNEAMEVIKPILLDEEPDLTRYLFKQLRAVAEYLGITTEFHLSSTISKNGLKNVDEKVFRICHHFDTIDYINPSGAGMQFYNKACWKKKGGINLHFLRRNEDIRYKQRSDEFVPDLSIIDLMMYCSREELHEILNRYHLL